MHHGYHTHPYLGKTICTHTLGYVRCMADRSERLKLARENAGFNSPREAARHFRWNENTYKARENGFRDFGVDEAKDYGRAFGVSWIWLVSGEGTTEPPTTTPVTVPLVGYVGAGAEAYFFSDQGEIDRVPAPDGSSPDTQGYNNA